MSNPTTPFSWQMPTATDLVTDLPADFEVFGQAVATSMADLLGGASGYILSKNSATDMDFVWIANDQGDITGVTAGTGITVTNPTGPTPTVAINTAVTADLTTAQTLTNKTLTSPALTTPTVSTLTTNGDLVYGTGSGALARLGIGSTSQVLTVAGGIPSWATPATAAAPGLAFVTSATFTAATTVSINSCFTSTYDNYVVTVNLSAGSGAGGNYYAKLRLSGTDSSASYAYNTLTTNATTVTSATLNGQTTGFPTDSNDQSRPAQTQFTLMSPAVGVYTWFASNAFSSNAGGQGVKINNGYHAIATAYDGLTLNWTGAATGTVRVYGMRNS
jgi:hypothetical protein